MVYCAATGSQYQVYMKLCLARAPLSTGCTDLLGTWVGVGGSRIAYRARSVHALMVRITHCSRRVCSTVHSANRKTQKEPCRTSSTSDVRYFLTGVLQRSLIQAPAILVM
jgi:hypothetical protein